MQIPMRKWRFPIIFGALAPVFIHSWMVLGHRKAFLDSANPFSISNQPSQNGTTPDTSTVCCLSLDNPQGFYWPLLKAFISF